jgi:hypothetical protein
MLPPFIIEQIRQREEEERRRQEEDARPRLELPLPVYDKPRRREEDSTGERGVIVIDLLG